MDSRMVLTWAFWAGLGATILVYIEVQLLCSWFFLARGRSHPSVSRSTINSSLLFVSLVGAFLVLFFPSVARLAGGSLAPPLALLGVLFYVVVPMAVSLLFDPNDLEPVQVKLPEWFLLGRLQAFQFRFRKGSRSSNARRAVSVITLVPLLLTVVSVVALIVT